MKKKEVAILAIDIEGRGPSMIDNGIISIGWVLGSSKALHVIKKGRIDLLPMKGQIFHQHTFENFWSKPINCTNLEIMQKNAVDPMIAMSRFRMIVDRYEEKYDLRIVADNTVYDIGYINYYLNKAGLPGLHFKADGKTFRPCYSTNDFSRGALKLDYNCEWVGDEGVMRKFHFRVDQELKDHMPENDAEYVYRFHLTLIKKLKDCFY